MLQLDFSCEGFLIDTKEQIHALAVRSTITTAAIHSVSFLLKLLLVIKKKEREKCSFKSYICVFCFYKSHLSLSDVVSTQIAPQQPELERTTGKSQLPKRW